MSLRVFFTCTSSIILNVLYMYINGQIENWPLENESFAGHKINIRPAADCSLNWGPQKVKGKYNNVKKYEWSTNSITYVHYKYVTLVVTWAKSASAEELIPIAGTNFPLQETVTNGFNHPRSCNIKNRIQAKENKHHIFCWQRYERGTCPVK